MKYRVRVHGEAFQSPVEFNVKDAVWWVRALPGVAAMTLTGKTVHLRYKLEKAIVVDRTQLIHEAIHIVQARKMGILYLPTYLWQSIRAGFNWRRIPMEVEAIMNEYKGEYEIL